MKLNRRTTLALLASAALPTRVFAQARLSYDLTPQPIGDGLWMIEGATEYFSKQNGGAIVNITLMQGETGLIVIDTGPSRRYGEALASVARQLDLRGVSAVINTHHHPDHFFGNQVFADRPTYALGETVSAARADGDGFSDNMYRLLGDWMRGTEVVPPTLVLTGGSVMVDGRDLTALPLSGHTVADLAVLDAASGTLVTGDLAFLDRAPTTPSADLVQWRASIAALGMLDVPQIVPGHGPLDRTRESLSQTDAYLGWLEEALRNAAREGQSMVEALMAPLPDRFAAMGAQPEEYERSVAHLYPTIEREELPRAN